MQQLKAWFLTRRPKLLFLVPAISQTNKSLENSQDFFVKTKTKTLGLKTKTLFFVLEAPRDQDFGLEDYITASKWKLHVRLMQ